MEIKVKQFLRRPRISNHSLERLYEDVRSSIPKICNDIYIETRVNKFRSNGILRRLLDSVFAGFSQADVNHVTGDVHYLTYFLNPGKTVLTILDCVALERSKGIRFWILWFFWYWLPEKRCVAINVISKSTHQQLLSYLNCKPEKVKIIYCSISPEFHPSPQPFNASCPHILHIGTLPNKNLEGHAEALAGLSCKLIIIGRLSEIQTLTLRKYNILYENLVDISREEVVNQYKRCDFLLFASTYEGFGLPIIEAQAVGRPVITSNIWSMPEVAGEAACLVDPFDVESIRSGIRQVIEDTEYREGLVQKGFENVERFRPEVIASQYADLYREVYSLSHRENDSVKDGRQRVK
jgi:glycosyltransferase involved in cell wall biosynthesis